MKISHIRTTICLDSYNFDIARNESGVLEIWAENDLDLAAGMGMAHAYDRLVQMVFTRTIGQGRVCELLKDSEEGITIDQTLRHLGFQHNAANQAALISASSREFLSAYCAGVNHIMETHSLPFELKMVGLKPAPWQVEDTLLTMELMSYVGLAESQGTAEKLIIQVIQKDVDLAKLKAIFTPHLDGVDDTLVELIKQVKLYEAPIPTDLPFKSFIPSLKGSNNWAVAGKKTASGNPIHCCDPHLEVNRLPAIWSEVVLHKSGRYAIGINVPGIPGLVMGRNDLVAFSFTYGFMDMVDYFIEEIKDNCYRQGDDYINCPLVKEIIKRRKGKDITVYTYRTPRGVLELDPTSEKLEDGFYLARAWSGTEAKLSSASSLDALIELLWTKSSANAQQTVQKVSISANWVISDRADDLRFQQSGLLPIRTHSGLFPLDARQDGVGWAGFHSPDQLASIDSTPESGYIATANNNLQPPDKPLSLSLPSGPYRQERISMLLESTEQITLDEMKLIQRDLYSLQAERLMHLIGEHLPNNDLARILKVWDLKYDKHSQGATLFEDIYQGILMRVFGEQLFGEKVWNYICQGSDIYADFYAHFDRIILEADTNFFSSSQERDQMVKEVVERVVSRYDGVAIPTWGARPLFSMTNIFFQGKLPQWLGFDHGPIMQEGCRATIVQGNLYKRHGRQTSFGPSYRAVTDMAEDQMHTVLAGGSSGRRFSGYYTSDISKWLNFEYKILKGRD
ncbi:MAG: penicillin acylase family protein [Bdellovibrionales bacterium]|nr:penicillin acylase family protein [Bdellovibrionales bacterium]